MITANIMIQNSVLPTTFVGLKCDAAALDRLHHAAALQRLVQPDATQQPLGALLDQLRQQVAGEEDDERADHRRNHFGELRERFAQALEEGQGLVLGELKHATNLGHARSEVRAQSSEEHPMVLSSEL